MLVKRTRNSLTILVAAAFAGVIVWWFFFHPYVSTDDARIAATLVRAAPESVGGRVIGINAREGDRVKKGDILVVLDHQIVEAHMERAKAKADLAQHELHRISELVAQQGLPTKELDNAKANAEITQAELKLAKVALENSTIKSPIDGIVVQKVTEEGNIVEPGQTLLTICDIDHAWVEANIEETS